MKTVQTNHWFWVHLQIPNLENNSTLQPIYHQILTVAAASAVATAIIIIMIITTTTTTHSPKRNEGIAVYFTNFSFVETKIL